MKSALFLVLFISVAHAAHLNISAFDQERLVTYINKLPSTLVKRHVSFSDDVKIVEQTFIPSSSAFEIHCISKYYDESPYPSLPTCSVELDEHHPSIDKHYDEWKITESSTEYVSDLFPAAAPRGDVRIFRSADFDQGTSFDGKRTNIFRYLIRCTASSCAYRFSEKHIQ